VERERECPLEDPARAGELALVAVGAEERQRVGADLRLDPLGTQLGEHPVAVVDLEHVGLPAVDVALVSARQRDGEVREPFGVAVRDPRARRQQLLEPVHLRDADRTEDVGEPVVQARRRHVGRVERAPAVVAELPHRVRDCVVGGRDGPALTGRDDLPRMEAEAARDAEPATRAAPVARAKGAGRVFEQRQVGQLVERQRPAEEVHAEQELRVPDLELRRVEVHGLGIDVDEARAEARELDDVRGRRERVGRNEHLVTRLEAEREHREVQRRSPGRASERMRDLARGGELRLELGDLRAHREHAALEDLGDLGELLLTDVGPP